MDRLRMSYDMEWPLGTLLFTPEVLRGNAAGECVCCRLVARAYMCAVNFSV